jgi:hypothetical protein
MNHISVFEPHPYVEVYISRIKEKKEARSNFVELVSRTGEIAYFFPPRKRIEFILKSKDQCDKYLKKRFRSEEEYPTNMRRMGMIMYYVYRNFMAHAFKVILGYYGISPSHYISFHRFSNTLYKRFEKASTRMWDVILEDTIERIVKDLSRGGVFINMTKKETIEDIFFIIGVTCARLYYWLFISGEGKEEIEIVLGEKEREKIKEIEEKLKEKTEEGSKEEEEEKGEAINERKA